MSAVKLTTKEVGSISITGFQMPTQEAIKDAIKSGLLKYESVEQFGGCGRVYVCCNADYVKHKDFDAKILSKLSSAIGKNVSLAVKDLGMIFNFGLYGIGNNAIYIGYDNADSIAWSKAVQVAKNLRELGIGAYEEGQGD